MGKALDFQEMPGRIRRRLYLSLPYVSALLTAYGVLGEAKAALWVGLFGIILGPIQGHVAAANVPADDAADTGGRSQPGG